MKANPYQQYRRNQVEMASPEELVLLCYKGAIKHLKRALLKWDSLTREEQHNYLMTAQAILEELTIGLNFEAGEMAENLLKLYDYMHRQLVQANNNKDPEPIKEVVSLLEELKTAWEEAASLRAQGEDKKEKE